jgi:hypothetical protein
VSFAAASYEQEPRQGKGVRFVDRSVRRTRQVSMNHVMRAALTDWAREVLDLSEPEIAAAFDERAALD